MAAKTSFPGRRISRAGRHSVPYFCNERGPDFIQFDGLEDVVQRLAEFHNLLEDSDEDEFHGFSQLDIQKVVRPQKDCRMNAKLGTRKKRKKTFSSPRRRTPTVSVGNLPSSKYCKTYNSASLKKLRDTVSNNQQMVMNDDSGNGIVGDSSSNYLRSSIAVSCAVTPSHPRLEVNHSGTKSKVHSSYFSRFCLPQRSAHSSRVITPNKRFLDIGDCSMQQKKQKLITKTGSSSKDISASNLSSVELASDPQGDRIDIGEQKVHHTISPVVDYCLINQIPVKIDCCINRLSSEVFDIVPSAAPSVRLKAEDLFEEIESRPCSIEHTSPSDSFTPHCGILQKPKLQLNQLDVDRSKEALALALHLQMAMDEDNKISNVPVDHSNQLISASAICSSADPAYMNEIGMSDEDETTISLEDSWQNWLDKTNHPLAKSAAVINKEEPFNVANANIMVSSSVVERPLNSQLGREIDREQGPRIKNVCRRAAVVLGRPATFPALMSTATAKSSSEINLSALPLREKQMFRKRSEGHAIDYDNIEDNTRTRLNDSCTASSSALSEARSADRSKPSTSQLRDINSPVVQDNFPNAGWNSHVEVKETLPPLADCGATELLHHSSESRVKKPRLLRCRKCAGCLAVDCGTCCACRDMVKFGGKGTHRKACKQRLCLDQPASIKSCSTDAVQPITRSSESANDACMSGTILRECKSELTQLLQQKLANNDMVDKLRGEVVCSDVKDTHKDERHTLISTDETLLLRRSRFCRPAQRNRSKPKSENIRDSVKRMESIEFDVEDNSAPATCMRSSVLILQQPIGLRAVCLMCGSVGCDPDDVLLNCAVCCEPYHSYCLPPDVRSFADRPAWCCPRCRHCRVCGTLNSCSLLQCSKCQDCYHEDCLGPSYPTLPAPERKHLDDTWLCAMCVLPANRWNTIPVPEQSITSSRTHASLRPIVTPSALNPGSVMSPIVGSDHTYFVNVSNNDTSPSQSPMTSPTLGSIHYESKPNEEEVTCAVGTCMKVALERACLGESLESLDEACSTDGCGYVTQDSVPVCSGVAAPEGNSIKCSGHSRLPAVSGPVRGDVDSRCCDLCLCCGDQSGREDVGRLLYAGGDCWVHAACALWSSRVDEQPAGVLRRVYSAISLAKKLQCGVCCRRGASVHCSYPKCTFVSHLTCARQVSCSFQRDRKAFCPSHAANTLSLFSNHLFGLNRHFFIKPRRLDRILSTLSGCAGRNVHLLTGSLTVQCLGKLTHLSDSETFLLPVGYCSSRVYWSTSDAHRRCIYTFRIIEERDSAASCGAQDEDTVHCESELACSDEREVSVSTYRMAPREISDTSNEKGVNGRSRDAGCRDNMCNVVAKLGRVQYGNPHEDCSTSYAAARTKIDYGHLPLSSGIGLLADGGCVQTNSIGVKKCESTSDEVREEHDRIDDNCCSFSVDGVTVSSSSLVSDQSLTLKNKPMLGFNLEENWKTSSPIPNISSIVGKNQLVQVDGTSVMDVDDESSSAEDSNEDGSGSSVLSEHLIVSSTTNRDEAGVVVAMISTEDSQDKTLLKCPKCRRIYRTAESCAKHIESCDFNVSSSSEESTEEALDALKDKNSQESDENGVNDDEDYEEDISRFLVRIQPDIPPIASISPGDGEHVIRFCEPVCNGVNRPEFKSSVREFLDVEAATLRPTIINTYTALDQVGTPTLKPKSCIPMSIGCNVNNVLTSSFSMFTNSPLSVASVNSTSNGVKSLVPTSASFCKLGQPKTIWSQPNPIANQLSLPLHLPRVEAGLSLVLAQSANVVQPNTRQGVIRRSTVNMNHAHSTNNLLPVECSSSRAVHQNKNPNTYSSTSKMNFPGTPLCVPAFSVPANLTGCERMARAYTMANWLQPVVSILPSTFKPSSSTRPTELLNYLVKQPGSQSLVFVPPLPAYSSVEQLASNISQSLVRPKPVNNSVSARVEKPDSAVTQFLGGSEPVFSLQREHVRTQNCSSSEVQNKSESLVNLAQVMKQSAPILFSSQAQTLSSSRTDLVQKFIQVQNQQINTSPSSAPINTCYVSFQPRAGHPSNRPSTVHSLPGTPPVFALPNIHSFSPAGVQFVMPCLQLGTRPVQQAVCLPLSTICPASAPTNQLPSAPFLSFYTNEQCRQLKPIEPSLSLALPLNAYTRVPIFNMRTSSEVQAFLSGRMIIPSSTSHAENFYATCLASSSSVSHLNHVSSVVPQRFLGIAASAATPTSTQERFALLSAPPLCYGRGLLPASNVLLLNQVQDSSQSRDGLHPAADPIVSSYHIGVPSFAFSKGAPLQATTSMIEAFGNQQPSNLVSFPFLGPRKGAPGANTSRATPNLPFSSSAACFVADTQSLTPAGQRANTLATGVGNEAGVLCASTSLNEYKRRHFAQMMQPLLFESRPVPALRLDVASKSVQLPVPSVTELQHVLLSNFIAPRHQLQYSIPPTGGSVPISQHVGSLNQTVLRGIDFNQQLSQATSLYKNNQGKEFLKLHQSYDNSLVSSSLQADQSSIEPSRCQTAQIDIGTNSLDLCWLNVDGSSVLMDSIDAGACTRNVVVDAYDDGDDDLHRSLLCNEYLRSAESTASTTKSTSSRLVFEIASDDGFFARADTCEEAWQLVIEEIKDARDRNRMKQLSFEGLTGLQMFGLACEVVQRLLELLPDVEKCQKYRRKFKLVESNKSFTHPAKEDKAPELQSGCARAEKYRGRKPIDMFSFLLSQHRPLPPDFRLSNLRRDTDYMASSKAQRRQSAAVSASVDMPMTMRFRQLRSSYKETVVVLRSGIHRRGLFARRDILDGEMVIEYAGEVIRSVLTDRREQIYERRRTGDVGCYMFRLSNSEVVDATLAGNAARFINHSCEPNCYSKVVDDGAGRKHIVILALRCIGRGEELTYDYKFPIEDVKIKCSCSSRRCKKFLN